MSTVSDRERDERQAREAELLDLSDLAVLAAWIAGVIAVGVVGYLTYQELTTTIGPVRAFFQRMGGLKTEQLAVRTLEALRTAMPYEPESVLKDKVAALFAEAGAPLDRSALPACPPVPAPTHVAPSKASGEVWDPFIAFATPDHVTALGLHARLAARGLRPFVDRQDIPAGAVWPKALTDAIAASRRFVFLLSHRIDEAWYQQDEVVRAVARIRTKEAVGIPVHLGSRPTNLDALPYGFASLQSLSLAELGGLEALADALVGSA